MRRKGQGSASISAVVVFLSALIALGLMATILPPVANVLSGFREGLRERGERGSELIRIYIHSTDETENAPPVITIINGWDRESILTDYFVVGWDGRVLAAGKMGGSFGSIRIPAGAKIDLTPAHFGLSYSTFVEMAKAVKAIYVRTAEGNSFGSSYGPPPKMTLDYQIVIVRATSSATTSSVVAIPRSSGSSGGGSSTSGTSSGGGGGSSSGGGGGGGGMGSTPPPKKCDFTGPLQVSCEQPDSGSRSSGSGSGGSGSSSGSSGGSSSSSSQSSQQQSQQPSQGPDRRYLPIPD